MENALYLISVSVCTGVFYLVYRILFRARVAFRLNRSYLIAGLIFSFMIPSLDLSFVPVDYHLHSTSQTTNPSWQQLENYYTATTAFASNSVDFSYVFILYWIGFSFPFFRFVRDVIRVMKIKTPAVISKNGSVTIAHAEVDQPFSCFNTVFLPRHGVSDLVLEHELAHVRQRHWIDLLIVESARAILWFNPVMIFYKRSLVIQHEYEADASILAKGVNVEDYLDCLLINLSCDNLKGLVRHFFAQNIKQRIIMMTRNNEPREFKALYLLFIPLACGLLLAFSSPASKRHHLIHSFAGEGNEFVVVVDPGHGGDDPGSSNDNIKEKDLALAIAKAIRKNGQDNGLKVILTRDDDKGLSLEDRISIAGEYKPNVFLSVHINNDPTNSTRSGIDIMISKSSNQFDKSNRVAEDLKFELASLAGINVNGVQNADFYLLTNSTSPSVLVELGYLSNGNDYAFIRDPRNQERISERIIKAITASKK